MLGRPDVCVAKSTSVIERPFSFRHSGPWGQVFGYWIIQCDFAALYHLGEQQRREHFCCRTDLKNRIAVHRTWITFFQVAVSNNPPPLRLDYTHNNANTLVLYIDSINEHLPNL